MARKGIPKDVREACGRLTNGCWEARLRNPRNLNPPEAKRQFTEWLPEVERRVARIKSEAAGEGPVLSTTPARALAGDWYRWFLAQHGEEFGDQESPDMPDDAEPTKSEVDAIVDEFGGNLRADMYALMYDLAVLAAGYDGAAPLDPIRVKATLNPILLSYTIAKPNKSS